MTDDGRNRLDPIETASRDEIAALQIERLRATLQHARDNVPHYRSRFDDAGLAPVDLESLENLCAFPFTVKEDLRRNFPFGMFAVPRERVMRIHASSGTTGTPTVVGYTRADLDMWADVMARSMRAAGVRSGDLVQISYGYGLFTGGLGFHGGAERLGCTVVPVSGGFTARQVQLVDQFRPRVITVTPSYMLALADEFARQGLDPRQSSLQIGMFGAEPWTESMRGEIESRFDMQALDVYGLSEVIGPGVSAECAESKDGLHIWEDHFYPEIIDPASGEVLPDGETGELVITSLTKEACPVIRYRTRDLTRLMPGTARSMRRMQKVTGRSDDMLIIRGVNLFPTQVEEILLGDDRLSPHYCLEVRREGRLDEIAILVEARAGAADEETRAAAERDVARDVKSRIGITCEVRVMEPESIERSIGKARRIVDLRPKD
ncbi:MAG: phenylacetate--CoA ligase [Chromatiales bacterium]|nr:phenylacetate--CoA ligase [Chromatiales bacterium]